MTTAELSLLDRNMMGRPPGPVSPLQRIGAIDVLRGVALFGVLANNLVSEFRVSSFAYLLPDDSAASPIDRIVELLMLAIDMKAFALFSLLFGVGLAIQFERLAGNARRMQLLLRRLIVLSAIGLLHLALIWNGDILTEYALAGFVVLPFLLGPRWLLACGAAMFLGLYLMMLHLLPTGAVSFDVSAHVAQANRIYGTGGFLEVMAFRIQEIPLILPWHARVIPRTIGLFLLGALVWRTGILRKGATHNALLLGVATTGVFLGAASIYATENDLFKADWISTVTDALGSIFMALGYGAAMIRVTNLARGNAWLGWAVPLGRMAFTNYLAQSVIFGWIFYGYGLGLFGLGEAATLGIGLFVYAAQAIFSAWWLVRYRYGPVEWLWRTLTYGASQPMSLTPKAQIV